MRRSAGRLNNLFLLRITRLLDFGRHVFSGTSYLEFWTVEKSRNPVILSVTHHRKKVIFLFVSNVNLLQIIAFIIITPLLLLLVVVILLLCFWEDCFV
jgi:hypothetical protein